MKLCELLVEYKIHNIEDNRRTSIQVIENPNKIQFMNLLNKDPEQQGPCCSGVVRGIVVNDDIYIWIAYTAAHFTVKQYLTMQGVVGEFILFIFELVEESDIDIKLWIYSNSAALARQDKLDSHPAFKRMTRNLKIGKWK